MCSVYAGHAHVGSGGSPQTSEFVPEQMIGTEKSLRNIWGWIFSLVCLFAFFARIDLSYSEHFSHLSMSNKFPQDLLQHE